MTSRPRRAAAAATLAVLTLLGTAACSDDAAGPTENQEADTDGDAKVSPEEVLAFAKAKLDETSGVRLTLSTDDKPDTDAYLSSAEGVITKAPAFEGTASGQFGGFPASGVEIISVDGKTYVNILGQWQDFDPAEFCAPDPALLLDPDTGVANVLSTANDVTAGESVRGGEDNKEVVTPYTATVPGATIKGGVLPCAPGDSFDATFTIDSDGLLQTAELTGEFFEGGGDVTYTIGIDEYDVEQEITAP